jgi:hypothetical protein
MTVIGYLIAALASIFIGNAIPHLTRGSAGYLHRVPWRVPASAAENVLWAAINLLIGIWLAYWAATFDLWPPLALTVGVIVGGGVLALIGTAFRTTRRNAGSSRTSAQCLIQRAYVSHSRTKLPTAKATPTIAATLSAITHPLGLLRSSATDKRSAISSRISFCARSSDETSS